jgi:hypothetical protein
MTARTLPLQPSAALPTILIAGAAPAAGLGFWLCCLEALDYPKSLLSLRIDATACEAAGAAQLAAFRLRACGDYAGIDIGARDAAEEAADAHAAMFVLGAGCFVRPDTLRALVALNLPLVAPMLRSTEDFMARSNFCATRDAEGRAVENEEYFWILYGRLKGVFEVATVSDTYLVRFDAAENSLAHRQSHVDNRKSYGFLAPRSWRAARLLMLDDVGGGVPSGYAPPDVFMLYGGIGDQIAWLSLLVEYRETHPGAITVVVAEGAQAIAALYAGRAYDHLRVVSGRIDAAAALDGSLVLQPNEMLAWHIAHGDGVFANYQELCLNRGIGVADLLRVLLGLPRDAPAHAPVPSVVASLSAARRFHQSELPAGRTVLLAPHAKSYPCAVGAQWWIDAVRHLTAAGFTVVTNTGNRGRGFDATGQEAELAYIPGTIAIDVPLDEIIPFSEFCGHVLATRSGLCDLLAHARTRKIVVFPIFAEPARQEWSRRLGAFWSISRAFGVTDVDEKFVAEDAAFDADILRDWGAATA